LSPRHKRPPFLKRNIIENYKRIIYIGKGQNPATPKNPAGPKFYFLYFMKLLGNIYFYNVQKTFSFSLNGTSKTLEMGQYQKTDLLNYFLGLNCFDYINNKLRFNKIVTIRFVNLFEKNLFFTLAGFNNLLKDQDLIFNLENETATFDVFVENNTVVNFKVFDAQNKIIFQEDIEVGSFKQSLIFNYPAVIYRPEYPTKFFNIFTNEEIYSVQTYLIV